jgi:hypothetical protein
VTLARKRRPTRQPGIVAAESLTRIARQLRDQRRTRPVSPASAVDVVAPPRQVTLELVGGRGHYDRVIAAIREAHTIVWIATANLKELLVEDGRAAPGRRRSIKRAAYVSILAVLDDLAARGVELRLLHAELPSRPFRESLAEHPRLVTGGLALRRCPRAPMPGPPITRR